MLDHQVQSNNEVDRSYFSKTPTKVMKAMSKFDSNNDYLVHRENVNKFPQDWTHCLFSFLRVWCAQQLSDDGDKIRAAKTFLHKTTPYYGRVLTQEGKFTLL